MTLPLWVLRAVLAAAGLAVWFWTQALIARRGFPRGQIGDRLLDLTASLNRFLWEHPRWADGVLIATSAVIDLIGIFLVVFGVFGPSIRPLVGLLLLFALRQVCQGLCALPAPERMIWRNPGFPSLLVTYGTASDLFFSGHTAIAVYGSIELAHYGGPLAVPWGLAIILVEATAVLVLRAHYTMDVFTGAVTALWVWTVASALAPGLDRSLAGMLG
ncbi:MAG: phosphatase PAP2-related protein [Thermoanaerobaculia bacterium]